MKVLFSANDPGGAEAIVPVVTALRAQHHEVQGILTGPAKRVFDRGGISYIDADEHRSGGVEQALAFRPDVMLVGTSGTISIDKEMMLKLGPAVPTVSVLDFWGNPVQRFSGEAGDLRFLTSVVCVMDEDMKRDMLAVGIPEERIAVTGNPHFEGFEHGITRDREDRTEILFVSQPISLSRERYGFDEFTVLDMVVRTLPLGHHVCIRLHPRDEPRKYDTYLSDRISLCAEASVHVDLSRAGLVLGMFSPVLLQAAAAGKQVVSVEPTSTGEDPLPTRSKDALLQVKSEVDLAAALSAYAGGSDVADPRRFQQLFPKGAALRVVRILERVVAS